MLPLLAFEISSITAPSTAYSDLTWHSQVLRKLVEAEWQRWVSTSRCRSIGAVSSTFISGRMPFGSKGAQEQSSKPSHDTSGEPTTGPDFDASLRRGHALVGPNHSSAHREPTLDTPVEW